VRIGIYALTGNEEHHAAAWEASCRGADVRVVTNTGATDGTSSILEAAGVTIVRGSVVPWRWDDAHNLSLHHLPSDLDVAFRLDMDERLQPGWREAIEQAWGDDANCLQYRYVWSFDEDGRPGLVMPCDRVHSRAGFRWQQATHEGLVCWTGPKRMKWCEGLEVHHLRDPGKSHPTDLFLLEVAVREAPHDARARFYLAREKDYQGCEDAVVEFSRYLSIRGGDPTERSYARRRIYAHTGDVQQLVAATREAPHEPDAWERLALREYHAKNWPTCLDFARKAINAGGHSTHCTDPQAVGRAYDLASVASWEMGEQPDALRYAREAVRRLPRDGRISGNVAAMEAVLEGRAEVA
jgi:hypothetical protein